MTTKEADRLRLLKNHADGMVTLSFWLHKAKTELVAIKHGSFLAIDTLNFE